MWENRFQIFAARAHCSPLVQHHFGGGADPPPTLAQLPTPLRCPDAPPRSQPAPTAPMPASAPATRRTIATLAGLRRLPLIGCACSPGPGPGPLQAGRIHKPRPQRQQARVDATRLQRLHLLSGGRVESGGLVLLGQEACVHALQLLLGLRGHRAQSAEDVRPCDA